MYPASAPIPSGSVVSVHPAGGAPPAPSARTGPSAARSTACCATIVPEGHVSGDDAAVVCETTRVFSEEVSHTGVLEVHGCVCMREQSLPVSVVGPRNSAPRRAQLWGRAPALLRPRCGRASNSQMKTLPRASRVRFISASVIAALSHVRQNTSAYGGSAWMSMTRHPYLLSRICRSTVPSGSGPRPRPLPAPPYQFVSGRGEVQCTTMTDSLRCRPRTGQQAAATACQ